jgi:hypothetical protein
MILPRLLVGKDEAFELEIPWFLMLFDSLLFISRFLIQISGQSVDSCPDWPSRPNHCAKILTSVRDNTDTFFKNQGQVIFN